MRLQIPKQIYFIDICTEAAEPYGSGHKLIAILIDTNDFFQYITCVENTYYSIIALVLI